MTLEGPDVPPTSVYRWRIGIVIPAFDEEASIEACVDSIIESLDAASKLRDSWIVVVADSCRDATATRAGERLGDLGKVLECTAASPGVARRLGAAEVLSHFAHHPADRLWLANTDADSQVDLHWISRQLRLAAEGFCAVAGIVRLNARQSPEIARAFLKDYVLHADGSHPHVHGANLGIRADAYLDAGGWSDLPLAEDHCLWSRVRTRGWNVISSIASVVTTSARLSGRARGGFADSLRLRYPRVSDASESIADR